MGNSKIHKWLYSGDPPHRFLMLPPELLEEPAFQKLSYAARAFYITLCVHKETAIQQGCLLKTLQEYNAILDWGLTEQQIRDEAMPNRRTKYTKGCYFVAPQKHMESYGYQKGYVSRLKKELLDGGFIKIVAGQKGRLSAWNRNVTLYQFSDDWKGKKIKTQ